MFSSPGKCLHYTEQSHVKRIPWEPSTLYFPGVPLNPLSTFLEKFLKCSKLDLKSKPAINVLSHMLHKSKVKWAEDFALGILGIYSRLDCYSARQRQECDHTYQTGDTPNIPGHTSYVCEVVTDTFTHTHLKRESKWKESLAYSRRKECRPGGLDSCWS